MPPAPVALPVSSPDSARSAVLPGDRLQGSDQDECELRKTKLSRSHTPTAPRLIVGAAFTCEFHRCSGTYSFEQPASPRSCRGHPRLSTSSTRSGVFLTQESVPQSTTCSLRIHGTEGRAIEDVMRRSGKQGEGAQQIGISRTERYGRLRKYGLNLSKGIDRADGVSGRSNGVMRWIMRRSKRMKRILREQWQYFLPATLQRGR